MKPTTDFALQMPSHTPSIHHNHQTITRKNTHSYSSNNNFISDKSEHLYQLQLQRQQQQQFYEQPKDISIPIYEDHFSYIQGSCNSSRDSDRQATMTTTTIHKHAPNTPRSKHHPQPQLYQSPNLYRLSLQLTTELDIHKWWDNVIDIFTSSYHATRILLSVPHDLTDTINTPWGVKAIYNKDSCCQSNTCYSESATDSCSSASSDTGHPVFENLKRFDCDSEPLVDNTGILRILRCGKIIVLSREYRLPGDDTTPNNKLNNFINSTTSSNNELKNFNSRSKLRKNLRSTDNKKNLDWDNFKDFHFNNEQGSPSWAGVLDTPCLNDLEEGQGSYFQDDERSSTYHPRLSDYEEFEQQQPSPWSQSPAPSPAVTDPNFNPFFQAIPEIDEDAFNPSSSSSSSPELYSSRNFNYPTVNDNNVYSIVHIPLIHPTTVKKNVAPTNSNHAPVPIAILSFLSCIVPYPPDLLKSLKGLAPFLATTLSVSMIHQQSVIQLSRATPTRDFNSQRRRSSQFSNVIPTPLSAGSFGADDEFSLSSGECSTASSNTSKWEYTTVFPPTYDRSPSLNSENDPNPFNNIQDFTKSDDYEFTPVSDATPLTMGSHSLPSNLTTSQRTMKNRRISLPADTTTWHRKRRRSRRSSRKSNPSGDILNTKMLRLMVDLMPSAVYTCSPETGDCTWVNMRLLKYTGLNLENLLGRGWIDVIHPDDRDSVLEMWNTTFSRGEGSSADYRMRRFDGQYRWFLGRAGPLRDARGVNIRWFGTCIDIHDQKLAEQRQSRQLHIEANEKKYRLLAEAIPQIVFTATPKDGITYVNNKWFAYSGQTEEQAKNLGFLSHVHPDDRAICRLPEDTQSDTEMGYSIEVRLLQSDGEYKWYLVKCISVEVSEQGRKWLGTCTDINDHKVLEQKLKEAHDAAKRSTESKTRFLSNMSHEIRTPLIGITGMINFMLATSLTTEQLDYAHTIQQSADALLLVINDILDLSKVEAGMMKLEMEPFSLHNMVEDTNELLSTLAIQKGLELSFIVDDNVPNVVCGDRIRLRQVLLNVIGNAIKFTTKGEVFSRCSINSEESELNENEIILLFEVIDTGDGFDSEEEAVMFKPFSQVDTSSTRKHGGSGLGLVISRQLIELHGGKMFCKSKKGSGSTFFFTAKFKIPPDSTDPRPSTPTSEEFNPFLRSSKIAVQSKSMEHSDLSSPPSSNSTQSSSTNPSFSTSIGSQSSDLSLSLLDPPNCIDSNNNYYDSSLSESPSSVSSPRPLSPSISRPSTPSSKFRKHVNLLYPVCVLIVADLPKSRETLVYYVHSILPKTPTTPDIDITCSFEEANDRLTSTEIKSYTHILINLASQDHIIMLCSKIKNLAHLSLSVTVILTTPIQRAGIMEGARNELPERVDFIFKPLNRTKMEGLFDHTTTVRDNFLKRRNTHQIVASQREVFKRMADDVGDKGFRVLLVEDNFVNQKVMTKYLTKVGLEVTVVDNGAQCLEKFYAQNHDYFSLILCDLFMPVKDGYETTAEIRSWEKQNLPNGPEIPIIALTANVMADVAKKCIEAGFTSYVSKPVSFSKLSDVIRKLLIKNNNNNDDDGGGGDNNSSDNGGVKHPALRTITE